MGVRMMIWRALSILAMHVTMHRPSPIHRWNNLMYHSFYPCRNTWVTAAWRMHSSTTWKYWSSSRAVWWTHKHEIGYRYPSDVWTKSFRIYTLETLRQDRPDMGDKTLETRHWRQDIGEKTCATRQWDRVDKCRPDIWDNVDQTLETRH